MTEWLDRALVTCPYYYKLCITETDFHCALKKLKVPVNQWPSFVNHGANATAHFFDNLDGGNVAIVTLGPRQKHTIPQVHAILVHEAMHIWRECREHFGEISPSAEFEAYAIQNLSQRLMESFERQTKKVKKK